jgi:hypothetical protein
MFTFASCDESATAPSTNLVYGPVQQIGNGTARSYIVTSAADPKVPVEVGFALSETALDGLPAAMATLLLDLPQSNPTPYTFLELNWNPEGHEPASVYDLAHFDFHYYRVGKAVRASILPTDPAYATKAASFPGAEFRPEFYLDAGTLGGVAPDAATVPEMGLHWLDTRSPELQMLAGNPEGHQAFTTTFIYGSWDGEFIFDEPMITRAYILAKKTATDPAVRDEVIPVSVAARHSPAGYYPDAYRIQWDPSIREYRVALTELVYRQ